MNTSTFKPVHAHMHHACRETLRQTCTAQTRATPAILRSSQQRRASSKSKACMLACCTQELLPLQAATPDRSWMDNWTWIQETQSTHARACMQGPCS